MSAGVITCIYCKQERPPSKEHALQRTLGGNITIPDVCAACNTGFSSMDQAIAERSPVTFTRLADTPASAFDARLGSRTTWTDAAGTVLEVAVTNEYQTVVLPQLHVRPDATVAYTARDQEGLDQLLAYIDKLVSTDTLGALRTVEDPNTETSAIVLHRSSEGYLRVPTPRHREWFINEIKKTWMTELRDRLTAATHHSTRTIPELTVHLTFDPNTIHRAVAKNAFNTLCIARGPSLVLQPEFDPLREYIRGDVQLPTTTSPDAIAVDERFVTPVPADDQVLSFGPAHTIIFIYQRPRLRAYVTLYALHQYVVTFPTIEYEQQEQLFGHYFSVDRTNNRALTETEIMTMLLQARPNLLGPHTKGALAFLQSLKE